MADGSDILNIGNIGGLDALRNSQLENLKRIQNSGPELTKSTSSAGRQDAAKRVAHKTSSEDAATQFEALLLHQMLQTMWSTLPKEGILSGSREESLYRDMLNEAVAKSISENQSIGIRDVIARDIDKLEK